MRGLLLVPLQPFAPRSCPPFAAGGGCGGLVVLELLLKRVFEATVLALFGSLWVAAFWVALRSFTVFCKLNLLIAPAPFLPEPAGCPPLCSSQGGTGARNLLRSCWLSSCCKFIFSVSAAPLFSTSFLEFLSCVWKLEF